MSFIDEDVPSILRRAGRCSSIVVVAHRDFEVASSGRISLEGERVASARDGNIAVETSLASTAPSERRAYDFQRCTAGWPRRGPGWGYGTPDLQHLEPSALPCSPPDIELQVGTAEEVDMTEGYFRTAT